MLLCGMCIEYIYIYMYGNVELCDHTMYLAMLMDESITNPESIGDIMTYKKKIITDFGYEKLGYYMYGHLSRKSLEFLKLIC